MDPDKKDKRKVLMSLPASTADKIRLYAAWRKQDVSEIVDELICDHLGHVPSTHPLAPALSMISAAS